MSLCNVIGDSSSSHQLDMISRSMAGLIVVTFSTPYANHVCPTVAEMPFMDIAAVTIAVRVFQQDILQRLQ